MAKAAVVLNMISADLFSLVTVPVVLKMTTPSLTRLKVLSKMS